MTDDNDNSGVQQLQQAAEAAGSAMKTLGEISYDPIEITVDDIEKSKTKAVVDLGDLEEWNEVVTTVQDILNTYDFGQLERTDKNTYLKHSDVYEVFQTRHEKYSFLVLEIKLSLNYGIEVKPFFSTSMTRGRYSKGEEK